jgi:hypothetical protein
MRRIIVMAVAALLVGGTAAAQASTYKTTYGDIYCSGQVTTEQIPYDTYLISGEESSPQTVFSQGDMVYLNKGADGGVKPGDEFLIMRPVKDEGRTVWFQYQASLRRAMGTQWLDAGRVRVLVVRPNVSIAEVVHTCDFLQRGDYARPAAPRREPVVQIEPLDHYAAPSGRPQAMVVSAKNFISQVGMGDIIYANVGSAQGAKEGDYIRIFRYQGTRHDTAYQIRRIQDRIFGFGKTPQPHGWKDLPREILGTGVVLRISENASTVLIIQSLREIYMGDYVELK